MCYTLFGITFYFLCWYFNIFYYAEFRNDIIGHILLGTCNIIALNICSENMNIFLESLTKGCHSVRILWQLTWLFGYYTFSMKFT